jgi:hypothetical protein
LGTSGLFTIGDQLSKGSADAKDHADLGKPVNDG